MEFTVSQIKTDIYLLRSIANHIVPEEVQLKYTIISLWQV